MKKMLNICFKKSKNQTHISPNCPNIKQPITSPILADTNELATFSSSWQTQFSCEGALDLYHVVSYSQPY